MAPRALVIMIVLCFATLQSATPDEGAAQVALRYSWATSIRSSKTRSLISRSAITLKLPKRSDLGGQSHSRGCIVFGTGFNQGHSPGYDSHLHDRFPYRHSPYPQSPYHTYSAGWPYGPHASGRYGYYAQYDLYTGRFITLGGARLRRTASGVSDQSVAGGALFLGDRGSIFRRHEEQWQVYRGRDWVFVTDPALKKKLQRSETQLLSPFS